MAVEHVRGVDGNLVPVLLAVRHPCPRPCGDDSCCRGPEVVEHKFGGMLNAFKFGAPPHGGAAPGIDRIVMMLADEPNIREVILFPLNQQAQDLLMQAPAEVTQKQLRELHIQVKLPPKLAEKSEN